jgi:exopolysaccharide biosynthesis protein
MLEEKGSEQKKTIVKSIALIALKCLSVVFTILIVVIMGLLAMMWVLAKGPSPTVQRMFVMTVKETSVMGFLADIYLSEAEVNLIMEPPAQDEQYNKTDTSLITLPAPKPSQPVNIPRQPTDDNDVPSDERDTSGAGGMVSGGSETGDIETGDDGMSLFEVVGSGYHGYMLVVQDPKRVFVCAPENLGGSGISLMNMVSRTGAVAGINGGGFDDPTGTSLGGVPDGVVICEGKVKWGAGSGSVNVIGFDADGILHVGTMSSSHAIDLGIQWAVSFGPTLISNGVPQKSSSGINPRTAIGQRADGAVLLLVIDGRQIVSLGATYDDLIEIFLDYGAVNAANLDGGSSTLMVLNGEIVNSSASVAGPRLLPTAFLVAPPE